MAVAFNVAVFSAPRDITFSAWYFSHLLVANETREAVAAYGNIIVCVLYGDGVYV